MSLAEGFIKYKERKKISSGLYKLISRWTSSETVEMRNGKTLEDEIDTINNKQFSDMESANLIPTPFYDGTDYTKEGIHFQVLDDYRIKLNGTSSGVTTGTSFRLSASSQLIPIPIGKYTLSGFTGGSRATYALYLAVRDETGTDVLSVRQYDAPVTFEVTQPNLTFRILFNIYANGVTFDNTIVGVMLEKGELAHDYVPPYVNMKAIYELGLQNKKRLDELSQIEELTSVESPMTW